MALEPSPKRAIVFFDGQDLYHATRHAFGYTYPNFDPIALASAVSNAHGWNLPRSASTRVFPTVKMTPSGTTSGPTSSPTSAGVAPPSTPDLLFTGTRLFACPAARNTVISRAKRRASTSASPST